MFSKPLRAQTSVARDTQAVQLCELASRRSGQRSRIPTGKRAPFVCGQRGVSEWTFTGTRPDGTRVEAHGCDLFTFRDGKIALKNSYRKNRPPLGMR